MFMVRVCANRTLIYHRIRQTNMQSQIQPMPCFCTTYESIKNIFKERFLKGEEKAYMTETNMWPEKSKIFISGHLQKTFLDPCTRKLCIQAQACRHNNHSMSMVGMECGSKGTPNLRVMFYFSFKKNSIAHKANTQMF